MEQKETLLNIEPVRLLDGEKLIRNELIERNQPIPDTVPSEVDVLTRLTNSPNRSEIGLNGPATASISFPGETNKQLHLFEALYGRDSLEIALDCLDTYPALARSTILTHAQLQGCSFNLLREEEPGRIVHEVRSLDSDEVAQKLTNERDWGWPYYGSVDATLKYVHLISEYSRRIPGGASIFNLPYIARNGSSSTVTHAYKEALGWITRRMDTNPEGLLEFKAAFPGSIENQGWKDSYDAYHHSDGAIANHQSGIASIEIQAEAYRALLDGARIFDMVFDDPKQAAELRARATWLKSSVLSSFWTNNRGGFFIIGTDRDNSGHLRQLAIKSSNMGYVLGMLDEDSADSEDTREAVIKQLFSPEMLGLNGIRTLASDELRYRPGAYHNGSVWIMDNKQISDYLNLAGYHRLEYLLDTKQLEVVNATNRFPEYSRGDNNPDRRINDRIIEVLDSKSDEINRIEQPPQDNQGWSASAIHAIKTKRLKGFEPTLPGSTQDLFEKHLIEAYGLSS